MLSQQCLGAFDHSSLRMFMCLSCANILLCVPLCLYILVLSILSLCPLARVSFPPVWLMNDCCLAFSGVSFPSFSCLPSLLSLSVSRLSSLSSSMWVSVLITSVFPSLPQFVLSLQSIVYHCPQCVASDIMPTNLMTRILSSCLHSLYLFSLAF